MSIRIDPIKNDADYERVQARLRSVFNVPLKDAEEEEEIRLLGEELERYSLERFAYHSYPSDGVYEIAVHLDFGRSSLADVLDVFGGLERFVEYMTRRRGLDAATLEALVAECGLDRAELEKPFCEEPGWDAISAEGQEPCGKPDCCLPREENWRIMLAEMLAVEQREGRTERELVGV